MRFLAPQWLWLLPALALFGLALGRRCRREYRRRLALFTAERLRTPLLDAGLLRGKGRRLLVVTLALLALAVALARPLGGLADQSAHRQGVSLLIALDGSSSMLAEDVAPNRLELAKAGIASLLDSLGGDRAGLLLFGGQATLVSPLTFDTVSLQLITRSLDPELVGKGGSSLTEAIRRSVEYFKNRPWQAKVLLLVTDGEETEGDAMLAAQEAWRKHGIRIFTAGTGTADGAAIPRLERNLRRERVRTGTVRDAQGKEVRSHLDAQLLRAVAEVGGGAYVDLRETRGSLRDLYQQSLRPLAAPMDEVPLRDYAEWGQLPLGLALALLVLEMLWPRRAPKGRTAPLVLAAAGLIAGAPVARADGATEVGGLWAARRYDEAFTVLQQAVLAHPDDALDRYNYAVGAYAARKFPVAAEAFEKLAATGEPDLSARSRAQLGNSLYRLGEEARTANPDGTIVLWEKACAAYQLAPEVPLAAANFPKVRGDLLGLLGNLAAGLDRAGDEAARLSGESAIPAWTKALGLLDKALKVAASEAESRPVATRRETISGKVYSALFRAAEDKRRRADIQRDQSLERAIDLLENAVADYAKALQQRPDDVPARTGKEEAAALLAPWRVEFADQLHAAGREARKTSVDDAVAHWRKAAGLYTRVLLENPADAAALRGQARNNAALHDGYVELGDLKQASAPLLPPEERDLQLETALGLYQAALALQPANPVTREKFLTLGRSLTTMFTTRGRGELEQGKALAAPKPPEAIAWLERAIQSFGQALRFDPAQADAKAGKKEAEELLKKLREKDAGEQRRRQGQGKDLKDAKDIEDPGKLALKLLDYKTDQLASKKQQNISVPENRPTKDW